MRPTSDSPRGGVVEDATAGAAGTAAAGSFVFSGGVGVAWASFEDVFSGAAAAFLGAGSSCLAAAPPGRTVSATAGKVHRPSGLQLLALQTM